MIKIINTEVYTNEHLFNQEYKQSLTKSLLKPITVSPIIEASDPIQEERLSICKSCEFYKNESGEPSCGQCGCPLKSKISIAEESCPLQKWAAIKTQSNGGCGCGKK
jgi:uncharacterized paraquat-inducible protein A